MMRNRQPVSDNREQVRVPPCKISDDIMGIVRQPRQLTLSLLGTFQVRLNGQPVSRFDYDKVRALLAYLTMEADFPHRRDVLAALLWPERTDKEARHSLSQALLKCRQALGDQDRTAPFILADRHTVQWNPSAPLQLDASRFARLLSACATHSHPRAETCAGCMARRQEAVALYRGDFIKGLSVGDSAAFEDWAVIQREWLHRLAMDALYQLARYHERRGEIDRASHYARRQVELEPWREEAHRQLMRLLLYSGQRSAALAQYETCTRILAKELGVEPSAETQALHAQIKTTDPHPPHNLPPQPTPFIGRQTELADISSLLADPDCRLLTLVGPGGMGKTRLALAAAERQLGRPADSPAPDSPGYSFFGHGIYFVSLVAVQTAAAIVPTIADALGLRLEAGTPGDRQPARSPKQQLLDYLRQKRLLLVLDNLEQLLTAQVSETVALLAEMAQTAPGAQLVVTSRERLQLPGEQTYTVQGLAYPESLAVTETSPTTIMDYPALALFDQVARRVQPDFVCDGEQARQVARICQCLMGMPLAIELAAAATNILSPAEIAAELVQSLDLLSATTRHTPARHRSVRAAFETSWQRLSQAEQDIFRKLSVFRGGFGRDAARQIAGASRPVLAALANKSFLHYRQTEHRYEIHELLRQFGAEKLAENQAMETTTHDRYSNFYCTFLQKREADLKSARQQAALAELGTEIENVQSAWNWAIARQRIKAFESVPDTLYLFYEWQGRYQEGEATCQAVLDKIGAIDCGNAQVVVRALIWQSAFLQSMQQTEKGLQRLELALKQLDNGHLSGCDTRAEKAFALERMGAIARYLDHEQARRMGEQSLKLYQEIGDRWGTANVLAMLSGIVRELADYERAKQLQEQSLALRRALGDQRGITDSLLDLACILDSGQIKKTEAIMKQGLALRREMGDQLGVARELAALGLPCLFSGRYAEAQTYLAESAAIFEKLGSRQDVIVTRLWMGTIRGFMGHYEQAMNVGQQCLAYFRDVGDRWETSRALFLMGWPAIATGDLVQAEQCLRECAAILREIGQRNLLCHALAMLSYVALKQGNALQARHYLSETLQTTIETRTTMAILLILPAQALILADQGDIIQSLELYTATIEYPMIAKKQWLDDVVGQHILAAAATLPPEVVAAAQERGRALDLWETASELLIELDSPITGIAGL